MMHLERGQFRPWAILTLLFLFGGLLSPLVEAAEPGATPVADADLPAPEAAPAETNVPVLTDDPPDVSLPAEEVPPTGLLPGTDAHRSRAEPGVLAAIEPLTTMYLTIAETTGRTVVFPDGQTACFSILLDPPAAHGSPYTIHCITEVDGVAEVFGGMPDVHFTAYSVAVWSNTTACDFVVNEPVVTDLESGLSRVDIGIDANCRSDPGAPAGPLDGFGITLSDSTGLDRSYPGAIRMEVVATPPLPVPLLHPICLDASYGQAITNPAGVVFPRDTTYDLVVASNATGCTPSWSSFREESVPPGVLVVGLIDVVLACEEDPAPAVNFDAVAFSLEYSSGAGRSYPGEICLAIAITPAVTVPGMETLCYSESPAAFGWNAAGAVLPRASSYEGVVVSNTTGCTPSWSFREVLSVDGPLIAVVDFVLTCGPSPSESYAGIGVTLTDSTGVDRTYDGEICIDVAIAPAVTIPGAVPQCFRSSYAQSGYPAAGAVLPRDSTYEGVIVSNATGCTTTWTWRDMEIPLPEPVDTDPGIVLPGVPEIIDDGPTTLPSGGGLMLVIDVIIDCDEPLEEPDGDLFQVGIAFSDVRLADVTYSGDVCVEIRVEPVTGVAATVPYCTDTTYRYFRLPGDDWSHHSTTTYTTTLVLNSTGCLVTIEPFRTFEVPLSPPLGHIQVWIDCDPPEEPEPSATPSATATATPTATTTTPAPSATTTPGGTKPASVPSDTTVTKLPSTGAGTDVAAGSAAPLVIFATIAVGAVIAGAIVRSGVDRPDGGVDRDGRR